MLVRAVVAFLLLPGTVALAVPVTLAWLVSGRSFSMVGIVPLSIGSVLLLWCVWTFYVEGKGTLAPWAPPESLVETGPYRFSRNPMYVAVFLMLLGWWLGFRSWPLLLYAVGVGAVFHLRVVVVEEHQLSDRHGRDWERYRSRVPRWFLQ